MTEQITVKPKTELNSSPSNSGQQTQNISINRTQLTNICAAGMGLCFFLPWFQLFGGTVSAFELIRNTGQNQILWLIPIFSAITIFAGITKRSQKVAAKLTGALPFCVAAYWYSKAGGDLTKILGFGAYLSFAFGAALEFLGGKSK